MSFFSRMGSLEDPERSSQSQTDVRKDIARIAEMRPVHAAFAWFRVKERVISDLQMEVTSVPSPPFAEDERGEWLEERFRLFGLQDVHRDELGNVFGTRPGTDASLPALALSAHIDTVFKPGTPIQVRREGDRLFGPGISDNGAGIAGLLALILAMRESELKTTAPLIFIGNVGEEGEGDLRGMRHIFGQQKWRDRIGRLLVLDGAGTDSIVAEALGSRRFEITVNGPGGHSWSDFGLPNPIVVLANAIERFSKTHLPATPKTTFNFGMIEGGTSINSIPERAMMRVDLRSAAGPEIDRLEAALRTAMDDAVARAQGEKRAGRPTLSYEMKSIGSRPAADLRLDARILQVVRAVDQHLKNHAHIHRASTDANIPLSLGIEAVALGAGGTGGGAHTVHEWYEPAERDLALKRILLSVLALAGTADIE
jgi:tripeptide aminopeptidase